MPEEKSADAVEKFLQEQKAVEDRKQALIDDLLRQRAEAIKAFDDKLAKLGYKSRDGKPRRSHHKQAQPPADASAKPGAKPKA
jgi:hypothetical protein